MVKKIHYCWFGGKKLPNDVKKCIKTWKKWLPDYEIKEWNETNFDINSNPFVKEAYENKKWAFVSDYVRIYALYNEGGLYLDTDVKILKDISHILDKEMFLGLEDSGYVGTAVIGVKEKNNKYIKEILDYYGTLKHFNINIMYNYANPVIITKILNNYKYEKDEKGIRIYDKNVYIYPRDYFFPLNYNYSEKEYTDNTCMVHLFNATWTSRGERRVIGVYRRFGTTLGKKINSFIDYIFSLKNRFLGLFSRPYYYFRMKFSIYCTRGRRIKRIKNEINQLNENYVVLNHPEDTQIKEILEGAFENSRYEIREQYTNKEAKAISKIIVDSNKKMIIFNRMFLRLG